MAEIHRVGDLDINENLQYQRRLWKIQRISWMLIGIILLAALSGAFGSGWLGYARVESPNHSIRLEYDRFGRYQADTKLQVYLVSAVQPQRELLVWFSRNYLEAVQIQQVIPEPTRVQVSSNRFIYAFDRFDDQPIAIAFTLQPEQIGMLSGSVGLENGESLKYHQFIYP